MRPGSAAVGAGRRLAACGTVGLAVATLGLSSLLGPVWGSVAPTIRQSVGAGAGGQLNGTSSDVSLSADGRFVAFASAAYNVVPDDTNGLQDVFVRDRVTGAVTRESVRTDGNQAIGGTAGMDKTKPGSSDPAISADGRYLVFASTTTNLVDDDTNGSQDIFLRDRQAGTTVRVSVDSTGNGADGHSYAAAISGDGCVVAFHSAATNLVAADSNGALDVFVRSCRSSNPERVSLSTGGTQGAGISLFPSVNRDGSLVVFESLASNLVAGDTNGVLDIFVRDLASATTVRESVSSDGAQGTGLSHEPSISPDGRFVVFVSAATNLVPADTNGVSDVFVRARSAGTTTLESVSSTETQANGKTSWPVLSDDGSLVAYYADATNLVDGDTNGVADVFIRDRLTGATTRESVDSGGGQGDQGSSVPALTADGRLVGFQSLATNLVPGDTNRRSDVFVHELSADSSSPTTTSTTVPTTSTTSTTSPPTSTTSTKKGGSSGGQK